MNRGPCLNSLPIFSPSFFLPQVPCPSVIVPDPPGRVLCTFYAPLNSSHSLFLVLTFIFVNSFMGHTSPPPSANMHNYNRPKLASMYELKIGPFWYEVIYFFIEALLRVEGQGTLTQKGGELSQKGGKHARRGGEPVADNHLFISRFQLYKIFYIFIIDRFSAFFS